MWLNVGVEHTAQTEYFTLYWGSFLKGNASENLERQQQLQGHYTFLALVSLPSVPRQAETEGHRYIMFSLQYSLDKKEMLL